MHSAHPLSKNRFFLQEHVDLKREYHLIETKIAVGIIITVYCVALGILSPSHSTFFLGSAMFVFGISSLSFVSTNQHFFTLQKYRAINLDISSGKPVLQARIAHSADPERAFLELIEEDPSIPFISDRECIEYSFDDPSIAARSRKNLQLILTHQQTWGCNDPKQRHENWKNFIRAAVAQESLALRQ
jgi:hypothetical protein